MRSEDEDIWNDIADGFIGAGRTGSDFTQLTCVRCGESFLETSHKFLECENCRTKTHYRTLLLKDGT